MRTPSRPLSAVAAAAALAAAALAAAAAAGAATNQAAQPHRSTGPQAAIAVSSTTPGPIRVFLRADAAHRDTFALTVVCPDPTQAGHAGAYARSTAPQPAGLSLTPNQAAAAQAAGPGYPAVFDLRTDWDLASKAHGPVATATGQDGQPMTAYVDPSAAAQVTCTPAR